MKVINVGDNYRIKSDKFCWILETRFDGKTATGEHKDVWTPSYYPTFEKIANRIVQEEAKHAETLEEIVQHMDRTAELLAQDLKTLEAKV